MAGSQAGARPRAGFETTRGALISLWALLGLAALLAVRGTFRPWSGGFFCCIEGTETNGGRMIVALGLALAALAIYALSVTWRYSPPSSDHSPPTGPASALAELNRSTSALAAVAAGVAAGIAIVELRPDPLGGLVMTTVGVVVATGAALALVVLTWGWPWSRPFLIVVVVTVTFGLLVGLADEEDRFAGLVPEISLLVLASAAVGALNDRLTPARRVITVALAAAVGLVVVAALPREDEFLALTVTNWHFAGIIVLAAAAIVVALLPLDRRLLAAIGVGAMVVANLFVVALQWWIQLTRTVNFPLWVGGVFATTLLAAGLAHRAGWLEPAGDPDGGRASGLSPLILLRVGVGLTAALHWIGVVVWFFDVEPIQPDLVSAVLSVVALLLLFPNGDRAGFGYSLIAFGGPVAVTIMAGATAVKVASRPVEEIGALGQFPALPQVNAAGIGLLALIAVSAGLGDRLILSRLGSAVAGGATLLAGTYILVEVTELPSLSAPWIRFGGFVTVFLPALALLALIFTDPVKRLGLIVAGILVAVAFTIPVSLFLPSRDIFSGVITPLITVGMVSVAVAVALFVRGAPTGWLEGAVASASLVLIAIGFFPLMTGGVSRFATWPLGTWAFIGLAVILVSADPTGPAGRPSAEWPPPAPDLVADRGPATVPSEHQPGPPVAWSDPSGGGSNWPTEPPILGS